MIDTFNINVIQKFWEYLACLGFFIIDFDEMSIKLMKINCHFFFV